MGPNVCRCCRYPLALCTHVDTYVSTELTSKVDQLIMHSTKCRAISASSRLRHKYHIWHNVFECIIASLRCIVSGSVYCETSLSSAELHSCTGYFTSGRGRCPLSSRSDRGYFWYQSQMDRRCKSQQRATLQPSVRLHWRTREPRVYVTWKNVRCRRLSCLATQKFPACECGRRLGRS